MLDRMVGIVGWMVAAGLQAWRVPIVVKVAELELGGPRGGGKALAGNPWLRSLIKRSFLFRESRKGRFLFPELRRSDESALRLYVKSDQHKTD